MSNAESDINWIFKTDALKIAPADAMCWYTSGRLGPYYINTHFLCGGEKTAIDILDFITAEASNTVSFIPALEQKLTAVYEQHQIYRAVIDQMASLIKSCCAENNIQYISGGQRRDWFFSPMIAKVLNLPHLYIYNDLSVFDAAGQPVSNLESANVINVADLLNTASSFTEKWQSAISKLNSTLVAAAAAVDRNEGGVENLQSSGVAHCINLFTINKDFFDAALEENLVTEQQHKLLINYIDAPKQAMDKWRHENPDYVQQCLESDQPKTRERAQKFLDLNRITN